jgi:DNA-directed RNA polymerase specialized sigma24 family protein
MGRRSRDVAGRRNTPAAPKPNVRTKNPNDPRSRTDEPVRIKAQHQPASQRQTPAPLEPDAQRATDARLRALGELDRIRTQLEQVTRRQRKVVRQAKDAGASWHQIGIALGTTPQGAHKRFRSLIEPNKP